MVSVEAGACVTPFLLHLFVLCVRVVLWFGLSSPAGGTCAAPLTVPLAW